MMISDEAVEAAAKAYRDQQAELGYPKWEDLAEDGREWRLDYMRKVLEAAEPHMLAPRTITTIEELSELPKDSIVLDIYGVANQLSIEWITDGPPERTWNTTGHDCKTHVALPAIVLHIPSPYRSQV